MALCDRLETNLDQSDATRRRPLNAIFYVVSEPTMEITA